jgi:hypothetical protein
VVTVHAVPFHDSASGEASENPTATHDVLDRHDTPQSADDGATTAVGIWVHVAPFHSRAVPPGDSCAVLPTAMHHTDDTHETELRGGVFAGSGVCCHAPPSSRSAKPTAKPKDAGPTWVEPTATHASGTEHDTSARTW